MGIIKEFKEFAIKGNLIDIAIGLIIGAAFGKVVSSMVDNVLMPPLGVLIGGIDFSDLAVQLKPAVIENGTSTPPVMLKYGQFLQDVIDFLIVASAVFMVVKTLNSLKKKNEPEVAKSTGPAPLTKDQELLIEIRDALKNKA